MTLVLKAKLRFYAKHIRNEAQRSKRALLDSGLVDSFEASKVLAASYEKYLADGIDEKYLARQSGDC